MDFESIIGLEVHVQMNTMTKMFCSCELFFGASPNTSVCPVCLGYPGALPVVNENAVRKAIAVGSVLRSKINLFSRFDRKSYFYPDLPKGYQITQNFYPILSGGTVSIHSGCDMETKTIRIHHVHLEEDAGKLTHNELENFSRVDLNRAGTPLLEIVSEPDIRNSEEAYHYLREIRMMMRYINASTANLEEGSLRCDANVSVRPLGISTFGTKVEIKNLNSFNGIRKAIDYEIERQITMIRCGEKVLQETRLYNAHKNITVAMRSKAGVADYRYFADPDLPAVFISEDLVEEIQLSLPEHPFDRRIRYHEKFNLPLKDCIVLTEQKDYADYFDAILQSADLDPKKVANWVMTEVMNRVNESKISISEFSEKVSPQNTADMLYFVKIGKINGKIAKDLFDEMLSSGKTASTLIEEKDLSQVKNLSELTSIVDVIIHDNPIQVQQFKEGKDKLFGFFVGQVMKATQGRANPEIVNTILQKKLR